MRKYGSQNAMNMQGKKNLHTLNQSKYKKEKIIFLTCAENAIAR